MRETKDASGKDVITIMCDYTADGLWFNGAAIDASCLIKDFGFKETDLEEIRDLIDKWQQMYETFDFYSPKADAEKTYASNDFLLFQKLGEYIFALMKDIPQDDYIIEYFDEKTKERIR